MRRYKIGRSDTNEIVIADASVSRVHAELAELGGGRFALKDLGSTYGTQVWRGQGWAPAADTEIRADTVIRFGEFQTTLMDVLSDAQRAALGLMPGVPAPPSPMPTTTPPPAPAAAPPAPTPTEKPPVAAPATAVPEAARTPTPPAPEVPSAPTPAPQPAAPTPRTAAAAPIAASAASGGRAPLSPRNETRAQPPRTDAAPHRPVPRMYPGRSAGRRRSVMIGLLGLGLFGGIAAIVVAAVLLLGDANPPPRGDAPPNAGNAEAQSRMLDACVKQWEAPERRCRCFLAAAGPHLLAADYDDFAEMMEAYVSGDIDRQESALQRATEKRGAPASSRLTAAFKGAVRDCQQ